MPTPKKLSALLGYLKHTVNKKDLEPATDEITADRLVTARNWISDKPVNILQWYIKKSDI